MGPSFSYERITVSFPFNLLTVMSRLPRSCTMLPLLRCALVLPIIILQPDSAAESKPVYQELIEYLSTSDDVLPMVPDTHPVNTLYNAEAVVPPQCYTRTEAKANPCYVCHQDQIPERENKMNDRDLQAAYSFSDVGMTNHWKNLFEDKQSRIAAISD